MAATDKELYLRIGRPHNTCLLCGKPIAGDLKHPSMLAPEPIAAGPGASHDDSLRRDYCSDCWASSAKDEDYVGFWVTGREPPKPRKARTKKERNVARFSWFEAIQSKDDPEMATRLYLLAHLLMKYGVFKWVKSEAAEAPDFPGKIAFRLTTSEELIWIEAVEPTDQEAAIIKQEIDEYLAHSVTDESAAQEPE